MVHENSYQAVNHEEFLPRPVPVKNSLTIGGHGSFPGHEGRAGSLYTIYTKFPDPLPNVTFDITRNRAQTLAPRPGDIRRTIMEYQQYRRIQIAELRPYIPGEPMDGISISAPDKENGSPKVGDMIARNPANHDDKWVVAEKYFNDNFEPLTEAPHKETSGRVSSIAAQVMAKARDDDYLPEQDAAFLFTAAKTLAGSCLSQTENDHAE